MRNFILANLEVVFPWLSLPGVGLISCVSILAYIGNDSRYYTPKQLRNVWFLGLISLAISIGRVVLPHSVVYQ